MPGTRPAPELPPGPRSALVVGTGTYADARLEALRSPARDAADLADVLGDPAIGGFDVTVLADRGIQDLRVGIQRFLAGRSADEFIVVYLSCHGVLSPQRHLYFAAGDTDRDLLEATGLEADWLIRLLDACRARRQVVLLDCCFSGAFARTKAGRGAQDVGLEDGFGTVDGRGRIVLTASRATEYSFEGQDLPDGSTAGSVFTAALVEGLRSGEADIDQDGLVSIGDAYEFVHARVLGTGAAQTPQQWTYGGEGKVVLARSAARVHAAAGTTSTAPDDEILRLLENPLPRLRLAAVEELGDWLVSRDPRRFSAARDALRRVVGRDDPPLAEAARRLLADFSPAAKVVALLDQAEHLLSASIPPEMQAPLLLRMMRSLPLADPRRAIYLGLAARRVETNKPALVADQLREAMAEALAPVDLSSAEDMAGSIEDGTFLQASALAKIGATLPPASGAPYLRQALRLGEGLAPADRGRLLLELAKAHPAALREEFTVEAMRFLKQAEASLDKTKALIGLASLIPAHDPRRRTLLHETEALSHGVLPWLPDLVAAWAPVDLDHAEHLATAIPPGLFQVRAMLAVATAAPPDDPRRALLSAHADKIAHAIPEPAVKVAALAELAAVLAPERRLDLLAEAEDLVATLPDATRVNALVTLALAWSEVEEP